MPSEFVRLAVKYQPRIFEGYLVSGVPDEVEYYRISFRVSCSCACESLSIIGIPGDEITLLCPITTRCPDCGKESLLFNVHEHGHDGEFGHGTGYPIFEGTPCEHHCIQCGSAQFNIKVSLTYQFEDEDLSEFEPTLAPNYFDTFGSTLECAVCNKVDYGGDYECA